MKRRTQGERDLFQTAKKALDERIGIAYKECGAELIRFVDLAEVLKEGRLALLDGANDGQLKLILKMTVDSLNKKQGGASCPPRKKSGKGIETAESTPSSTLAAPVTSRLALITTPTSTAGAPADIREERGCQPAAQ